MYVCFQAYGNTPTCIKLQNVKKKSNIRISKLRNLEYSRSSHFPEEFNISCSITVQYPDENLNFCIVIYLANLSETFVYRS